MNTNWVTTSTLLHDLRVDRSAPAWDRFVLRFHAPIVRFSIELGVESGDAEDVAQETLLAFLDAFRDGKYERERGRLSKWLFGIAYRRALRQRDQYRRRGDTLPDQNDLAEPPANDLWDRLWEQQVVRECIVRVREEFSDEIVRAFELVVGDGYSPPEAAKELGVSTKQVYNAKHRVLKRIRELRGELEDPGHGLLAP